MSEANPFLLAFKTCKNKVTTAKDYLIKIEEMSEDEANEYLAQVNSQGE